MHAYVTWKHGTPHYVATFEEARAAVREEPTVGERVAVCVDLVDVDTSKAGVLRILNSRGGYQTTLRSWQGTARGGLKECRVEKQA